MDEIPALGIKIASMLAGGVVAHFALRLLVWRVLAKYGEKEARRANMLRPMLRAATRAIIGTITVLMVLDAAGIDIGALIAFVGVAGIAIAFGVRSLIEDLITYGIARLSNDYVEGEMIRADNREGKLIDIDLTGLAIWCQPENAKPHMSYIPWAKVRGTTIDNFDRTPETV